MPRAKIIGSGYQIWWRSRTALAVRFYIPNATTVGFVRTSEREGSCIIVDEPFCQLGITLAPSATLKKDTSR